MPLIVLWPLVASTSAFFVVCSLPPRIVPPNEVDLFVSAGNQHQAGAGVADGGILDAYAGADPRRQDGAGVGDIAVDEEDAAAGRFHLAGIDRRGPGRDDERKSVVGVDRAAAAHRKLARDQADADDRAAARHGRIQAGAARHDLLGNTLADREIAQREAGAHYQRGAGAELERTAAAAEEFERAAVADAHRAGRRPAGEHLHGDALAGAEIAQREAGARLQGAAGEHGQAGRGIAARGARPRRPRRRWPCRRR